jgi:hypothetical protein
MVTVSYMFAGQMSATAGMRSAAVCRLARLFSKPAAKEGAEQIVKHNSDDIIRYGCRYSDDAARVLIKRSPYISRGVITSAKAGKTAGGIITKTTLKKAGISKSLVKTFGKESAEKITKHVPAKDIPRLLKYGEMADSQATRDLLVKAYKKEGKDIFKRIPPKLVLATGLSASMIIGTHRATAPFPALGNIFNGLTPEAKEHLASETVVGGTVIGIVIVLVIAHRFRRRRPHHKKTGSKPNIIFRAVKGLFNTIKDMIMFVISKISSYSRPNKGRHSKTAGMV